jgi:radical SAM protein with 4Fe4S-binding SPASM domain
VSADALTALTAQAPPRDEPQQCADSSIVGMEGGFAMIGAIQATAQKCVVPLNASLELTQNCNIRCLHCYNFDRDEPKSVRAAACADAKPELTLPEILSLVGDLRAAGCLFLSLTGGEVLTYPHLFAVLDRARDLNLAVQLLTNGTLLRPGVASRLAGYRNLLGVSISLYGGTPEVHDGITQVKGSFRRTWDGATRMRALGIAVRLKFIIMKANAHEVEAMMARAAAHGIPYLADVTITSRHDGDRGSTATRVDEDQIMSLYGGPLRALLPNGPRKSTEETYRCNCARGNCAITSRGDVQPCISVPWVAGNIREQSFAEIWRSSPVFQRIRGLKEADYTACAPCPDKGFCSRDRGAAFTASGSYTGIDPFVCRTASLTRKIVERSAP